MGERTVTAYTWKDLFRTKREYLLDAYFREEGGRTLYVPWGTRGLMSPSRRTYVVPSEAVRNRMLEAHARWSLVATVLLAGIVAALALLVAFRPELAFRSLDAAPWLWLAGILVLWLVPAYLPSGMALRAAGPLERGPTR
jgi:hypothetical protein